VLLLYNRVKHLGDLARLVQEVMPMTVAVPEGA